MGHAFFVCCCVDAICAEGLIERSAPWEALNNITNGLGRLPKSWIIRARRWWRSCRSLRREWWLHDWRNFVQEGRVMNAVEPGIVVFFILVPTLIADFWVVYIAYSHTERLESYLPNSKFVRANRHALSGAGFVGKVVRNGFLVIALILPGFVASKGLCDFKEIKVFPAKEKMLLLVFWGLLFFLILALVAFHFWNK